MSNALAIATATTALAQIVRRAAQSAVAGSDCLTERPPATPGVEPRVRLFLYQATPSGALRNDDLPLRAADGTLVRRAIVPLDLSFLLAFHGNESELEPQRMLGAVVRDLNDQPVLTRQMIADAVTSQLFLATSDLADAPEKVKFTPLPMSMDELSKLWSVLFQTPYALSVAYRATVILIDGEALGRRALPVLSRGEEDRGVDALVGAFPFPAFDAIHIGLAGDDERAPPRSHPSAQIGSLLTLTGRNLAGDSAKVRFAHPRLEAPFEIEVDPAEHRPTRLRVPVDADAQPKWTAGLYTVELVIRQNGADRVSNRRALALAPRIAAIAPPNPILRDAAGAAVLTVTCQPRVLPGQAAVLQLAGREVDSEERLAAAADLVFTIRDAPAVANAIIRLRMDGVDSLPFVRQEPPLPPRLVFDTKQMVSIQ